MPPDELVDTLTKLVAKLPEGDRVSCGFPGMVRQGHVLSAPHFVLAKGPGTKVDPRARRRPGRTSTWPRALAKSIGKPCRVANDADVQGLAVVRGQGLRGGDHPRHRLRHGLLHGRPPHAPPGVLPPRVPQGRDLQRAARRAGPQEDRRRALEQAGAQGHRLPRCADASSTTSTSAAATAAASTGATWATCSSASPSWTTRRASSAASSSGTSQHVGVEGGPQ